MNVNDFTSLSEFLLGVPWEPPLPALASLDPDLAQVYMTQMNSLPGSLIYQMLITWDAIRKQPPAQWAASVTTLILNDANLGPLARQIILAWYTGFLPWSPGQQPTPDPANYERTLVWLLAQAHPMGVPLSFGYWQYNPATSGSSAGNQ